MEHNETEEIELTDETEVRGVPWAELKKDMKKVGFSKRYSTPRDRKLIAKLMEA